MTFQAVEKTDIDAVTVAPYAKVRADGSIEYGVVDYDGDQWIVAILSAEGVLKTEGYVSEAFTGIGDLKVTQGGEELTKVQPEMGAKPCSFTDSKGQEWSFREGYNGVTVVCDVWNLVEFNETGMSRFSSAVGNSYQPAIAADGSRVLVKDIAPAPAPAPQADKVHTLYNGTTIQLRSSGDEPELIINGEMMGWFETVDGKTMFYIEEEDESITLDDMLSACEQPQADKVHTLANGTTVQLRTWTNEPELIIDGENQGWFMSDGDGETVFRLKGKYTSIALDDMLSVREEPEAVSDKVFKDGEYASIKFELSSGDIMTVRRTSIERNPVILINGDRLDYVVNCKKPTKEIFFSDDLLTSSSRVTASMASDAATSGAMPIGRNSVIELKESTNLPDIYINGEWIGWLKLDGRELTLCTGLSSKYTSKAMY